jgi:arylsulfatase A-like enzyme
MRFPLLKSKLFFLLGVWLVLFTSCDNEQPAPDYHCPDCNIILITLDTVRADHLPCYGYGKNTTPFLCDFATDAMLFENAFTQMPLTGPSHASLLSSRYPDSHGLTTHHTKLNANVTFLSQLLKRERYTTGAFTHCLNIVARYGFDRGFDTYEHNGSHGADQISAEAVDWLQNNKEKKFFLWVHYFDAHWPYDPPPPYNKMYSTGKTRFDRYNNWTYQDNNDLFKALLANNSLNSEDIQRATDLYDGEIRFVDDQLPRLFRYLQESGLDKKTIIVITADHGESFDHGFYFVHPYTLYDSTIHVPLIMRFPGFTRNGRVKELVELVDVVPTILNVLNLSIPSEFEGSSLLPSTRGETVPSYAVSQAVVYRYANPRCSLYGNGAIPRSIRTDRWKLIAYQCNGSYEYELYDIQSDPQELIDVSEQNPEVVDELHATLVDKVEKIGRKATDSRNDTVVLDQEDINQLRALGYMQ